MKLINHYPGGPELRQIRISADAFAWTISVLLIAAGILIF